MVHSKNQMGGGLDINMNCTRYTKKIRSKRLLWTGHKERMDPTVPARRDGSR